MSAFGTAELARCGRVICPESFHEAWLEYVVALGTDIIHALEVDHADEDGKSVTTGRPMTR